MILLDIIRLDPTWLSHQLGSLINLTLPSTWLSHELGSLINLALPSTWLSHQLGSLINLASHQLGSPINLALPSTWSNTAADRLLPYQARLICQRGWTLSKRLPASHLCPEARLRWSQSTVEHRICRRSNRVGSCTTLDDPGRSVAVFFSPRLAPFWQSAMVLVANLI